MEALRPREYTDGPRFLPSGSARRPGGNLGRHNSTAIDGAIWGNLWQVRKPAGSSVFSTMLVDFTGDVGRHTSTAMDSGHAVTTYYDVTRKVLILVKVAK